MLDLALRARIPLITCTTTDTVNVPKVLRFLLKGHNPRRFESSVETLKKGETFYAFGDEVKHPQGPIEKIHSWLEVNQCSLVLMNPPGGSLDIGFDAGVMPTPEELVRKLLEDSGLGVKEQQDELLTSLGGLTLTECSWALRLAMAREKEASRNAVAAIRKECFPPKRGLIPVEGDGHYQPAPWLSGWAAQEKLFFLKGVKELRPRGLLFDGPPGTGKTQGAKWLADELGVPCYRLELGEVKGKWVGDSEKAMLSALREVDAEEPAVLLIDEVEKVFTQTVSDSGVSQNLLATLLWWLQEHTTRVLTVMTTNKKQALPPELYRPGRIDACHVFENLTTTHAAKTFAGAVQKQFKLPGGSAEDAMGILSAQGGADGAGASHAMVKQAVIEAGKARIREAVSRNGAGAKARKRYRLH